MRTKKILTVLLVLVLLLTFTGCNMVFVNKELDAQQVIAVVNGDTLYKSDLLRDYNSYKYMYDITDANENSASNAETVKAMKESIYDELVSFRVIYQKAVEFGVAELSQDQKDDINEYIEMRKTSIKNSVTTQVETEMETNEGIDKEAEIAARTEKQCKAEGLLDGSYYDRMSREYIRQNVKEYLGKDYVCEEEDLKAFYEENLDSQKRALTDNPQNVAAYESTGYSLYVPEGLRYVKNLLIAIPDDVKTEIQNLRFDGKDAEADALRDSELAKIREEADTVYALASAPGADFDAILAEHGDDPGMQSGTAKEKGYLICAGLEDFDELFVNAGMALSNVGDISEPVASDFGYYIIQYASEKPAGTKTYEESVDSFYDIVKDEMVERFYDESVEQWKKESDIKEYKDRIYY